MRVEYHPGESSAMAIIQAVVTITVTTPISAARTIVVCAGWFELRATLDPS